MKHGHNSNFGERSPTYVSWLGLKQRCLNPNGSDYPDYGGKGVTVCDRWLDFENFLADMGERPEGTTLDRFPNRNGDYEPGNCRWATLRQQANNRSNNRIIQTPRGPMTIGEAAALTGINKVTLKSRADHNWPAADMFDPPNRKRKKLRKVERN